MTQRLKVLTVIIGMVVLFAALFIRFNDENIEIGKKPETVTHYVALENNKANPSELIIKSGEFVQFESKDGKSHNVGLGKGDDYDNNHDHNENIDLESGLFGPDEAYKLQIIKPGIYYFHDHLNSKIFTTVVVYDPNKTE